MAKRLHYLLLCLVGIAVLALGRGFTTGEFKWIASSSQMPTPQVAATTTQNLTATPSSTAITANATVAEVVDGDTIKVRLDGEDKIYTIRFLGINTPETVDPRRPVECFGKEASAKMHELADGKRIRLEPDPQADEWDKYGRLLRNVYLDDRTDVNAYMVREGYAYAYLSFPLNPKRKAELKKLENDAKIAQRGLWSPQGCGGKK